MVNVQLMRALSALRTSLPAGDLEDERRSHRHLAAGERTTPPPATDQNHCGRVLARKRLTYVADKTQKVPPPSCAPFALSGAASPSTLTDSESRRALRLRHPPERQESLFCPRRPVTPARDGARTASRQPDLEISMRDHSKVLFLGLLLAVGVGCSQGSAGRVVPDAGATDATADGDARSYAAADAMDANDAIQNGDGGADQTTFSCGDASCRAPAEYCNGTEGPGGAFTKIAYIGCTSTPAMCLSDYNCACLLGTNCIEADGGVTSLIGLP
jgi:hypothetical protein